jgi:hypothetical protein
VVLPGARPGRRVLVPHQRALLAEVTQGLVVTIRADEAVGEHTHTEEHEEREREARAEGRLLLYPLSPKMFRGRTPQEVEGLRLGLERERAERYRAMYTNLGLRIVAHKGGALELTWRAGEGVSQVCASPRCTGPATIS